MAHSITITSTRSADFTFFMKFAPGRTETVLIPAGGTYTRDSDQVSGFTSLSSGRIFSKTQKGTTWDAFINHPEMQHIIRGEVPNLTAVLSYDQELDYQGIEASYENGYFASDSFFYVTMAAGAGGSPDDVTLLTSAPFPMTITDAELYVTDVVAAESVTLRDTVGGAGTALSSALDSTNAVKVESNLGLMPAIGEGDSIFARRTDDGIGGIWKIYYIRTGL